MSDFTAADLKALNEAIASGATSVKYADKQVNYRSLDEMVRIRDLMRKSIGTKTSRPKRYFPYISESYRR